MEKAAERKLFTAELQRLKAKGITMPAAISHAVAAPAPELDEILKAINGLRGDIQAVEQLVRGEEAHQRAVALVEDDDVVARKRAEVNMLRTEIRALSIAIAQTKTEIAALRPSNAEDDRLVAVTNELDAIVSSTERATHGILESAERIDNLAHQLQAQSGEGFAAHIAEDIRDSVVGIFEQCNFQDITGQRITKVVKTLQFIEERVNKMIEIWGADTFEDLPSPPEVDEDDEKKLLNGPALENEGISQADIDKLFS